MTTSKSQEDYTSRLNYITENKETRDGEKASTFTEKKKFTVPLTSVYSPTTVVQIDTNLDDNNDEHPQSKEERKYFWFLILIPSLSLILIILLLFGWSFWKLLKKRTTSPENQLNINSDDVFEMSTVINDNFQETSFDESR